MKTHTPLKTLAQTAKPREKLLHWGTDALSTPELLALILGTGTKTENVLQLSKRICRSFTSLKELQSAEFQELLKVKGIGPAQASRLLACFALAVRLMHQETEIAIMSPNAVVREVKDIIQTSREQLVVLYLNVRHQLINKQIVAIGSLNQMIIHPRDVFTEAVRFPCYGIILVHNHPSGELSPSDDDVLMTQRMVEAGKILGITVLDHVIVNKNSYWSLHEHGQMSLDK